MAGKKVFEVHTFSDKRWVFSREFQTEGKAKEAAELMLKQRDVEGVKVVSNWERPDGTYIEREVFNEMKAVPLERDVAITPIQDGPVCETLEDYYKPAARIAMARMLRKYFDVVTLTPTELLHSARDIKQAYANDTLLPTAVDRIAAIHAEKLGIDVQHRRAEVFRRVDEIFARARQADKAKLPSTEGKSMGAIINHFETRLGPDEGRYMAMVAFTRELSDMRNWMSKLERLVPMLRSEKRPVAREVLDGIIADILCMPQALQDVLGMSYSVGEFVNRLLSFVQGECPPNRSSSEELLASLNACFAAGLLPQTEAVLMDRAARELASSKKLVEDIGDQGELPAFEMLLDRLTRGGRVTGGAAMAEAALERGSRLINVGGSKGRQESLSKCLANMQAPRQRLTLLFALFEGDHAAELTDTLIDWIQRNMDDLQLLQNFSDDARGPKEMMAQAAAMQAWVGRLPIPSEKKDQFFRYFDDLVVRFIEREKVIERIDDPAMPLYKRANLLVQFVVSGVLTEGRAQVLAREHVLQYLRQPNFVEKFLADIADPGEQESTLRDFYVLLDEAGFSRVG